MTRISGPLWDGGGLNWLLDKVELRRGFWVGQSGTGTAKGSGRAKAAAERGFVLTRNPKKRPGYRHVSR